MIPTTVVTTAIVMWILLPWEVSWACVAVSVGSIVLARRLGVGDETLPWDGDCVVGEFVGASVVGDSVGGAVGEAVGTEVVGASVGIGGQ